MSYNFEPWALEQMREHREAQFAKSQRRWQQHATRLSGDRCIHFSQACNVILIPCRKEYNDAKIDLWHSNEVFHSAKVEASTEIKAEMEANGYTFQEAVRELYQPPPNPKDFIECKLFDRMSELDMDFDMEILDIEENAKAASKDNKSKM